jgi:peptidoglycan L-alanyl-D-glutamate endopeptidase CwlK
VAFKFSTRSLKRLQGVHPDLVRVISRALELTPVDFAVIEGLRTVARQKQLVAAGASQTMASRHITGDAVDLGAWVGTIRWDLGLYYQIAEAMQQASKDLQVPIRWGGAWARLDSTSKSPDVLVAEYVATRKRQGRKAFIDGPHFELPSEVYQ